jgi:thiol-disulfide isomerase/thioredoxin
MKKKFFISLFIVAAIGLFVFAGVVLKKNVEAKKQVNYTPQQNLQAPIEIPSTGIITLIEAEKLEKPIVALFYVDWCAYCRKFMPTFGEFAEKYKNDYTFAVVNCDKPENLEKVKEFHIMGFPSLFIVDKKINHKFSLHMASSADKSIFQEELDNYLAARKNFMK